MTTQPPEAQTPNLDGPPTPEAGVIATVDFNFRSSTADATHTQHIRDEHDDRQSPHEKIEQRRWFLDNI